MSKLAATAQKTSSNKCDSTDLPRSVRKIPRSYRNVTGHVFFRDGEPGVPFESPLEKDYLLLQRFSLAVAHVVSQPCAVAFVGPSGRKYTYTPDFLVTYRHTPGSLKQQRKPLLVEVKPTADWKANWREWSAKWKAARRYAIEMGWRFTIMDDRRIRTLALDNIKFLRRYEDLEFEEALNLCILEDLEELGLIEFEYLLNQYFTPAHRAEGVAQLWSLVANRRIECDVCWPLNLNTELWIPTNE